MQMTGDQTNRVLILGGYGNAGRCIARYLLKEVPDLQLILAGRNLEKAQNTAYLLNETYPLDKPTGVHARRVDAANKEVLKQAFDEADLVINASSTIPYTRQLLEAALATRTDYLDTQLSSADKWRVLRQHQDHIRKAGICYVTDGGYHPGVPAALVRYAAGQVDELHSAHVYGALRLDWGGLEFSPSTVKELVDEFKHFQPLVYREGAWRKQSFRDLPAFDFGEPIGKLTCTPMHMEEMQALPDLIPTLRETGFYVSGFNPVTDNWVMPIVYMGVKMLPRNWSMPLARLFHWSLKYSRPPFGLQLTTVCKGIKAGEPVCFRVSLSHSDGYVFTAIPVVSCVRRLLTGNIRQPGLWMQAQIVEPAPFLEDMKRMGIEVKKAGFPNRIPLSGASTGR